MSLPSSEPLPPESAARQRRRRRLSIPPNADERAVYLAALSQRLLPDFDTFLFTGICALVAACALLLDQPVLWVLAALVAPTPLLLSGAALGLHTANARYFAQELGAFLGVSLVLGLAGALAGLATRLGWAASLAVSAAHFFTWNWYLPLVAAGAMLLLSLWSARSSTPAPRAGAAAAAVAYCAWLPAAAAGFGFAAGNVSGALAALGLFATALLAALLAAWAGLYLAGLRPQSILAWALAGVVAALTLLALAASARAFAGARAASPPPATATPAAAASPTNTPRTQTPTPGSKTPTVAPTRPRATPSRTPEAGPSATPLAIEAEIAAPEGGGALIREKPGYNSAVIQTLINGKSVAALSEEIEIEDAVWIRVRLEDGRTGWVVKSLLVFP